MVEIDKKNHLFTIAGECCNLAVCSQTADHALLVSPWPLEDLSATADWGSALPRCSFYRHLLGTGSSAAGGRRGLAPRAGEHHMGKKLSISCCVEFSSEEVLTTNSLLKGSEI